MFLVCSLAMLRSEKEVIVCINFEEAEENYVMRSFVFRFLPQILWRCKKSRMKRDRHAARMGEMRYSYKI
jgi:hypothetical protein